MKLDLYFTPYTKTISRLFKDLNISHHILNINSKWVKALNVRAKTIKLLEDDIDVNLHNLGLVDGF